jgi:hypothetical protein
MKFISRHKINFTVLTFLFIFLFSGNLLAQRERISADGKQSVRSRDETPRERQNVKDDAEPVAQEFARFTGNISNVRAAKSGNAALGTILCDAYQSEFQPMFQDATFAKSHFPLNADQFAIAFLLFADNPEVRAVFNTDMDLAVARAAVQVGKSPKSFEEILVERGIFDKSRAKAAVKAAEKRAKEAQRK